LTARSAGATSAIALSRVNKPSNSQAFLVLLIGGVCIGFAAVLVRCSDVGPVASAFWRLCLATPMLWALVWLRAPPPAARIAVGPSWPAAVWLAGLYFAADLGTWHFSITQTTVANATLLANCAPLLVTIYTLLVLRQRPSAGFLVALTLAMAGAVALVSPKLQTQGTQLRGDTLAFLAACFYTAYMLAIKRARMQFDTVRLMALTTTISAVVLLPVAWILAATLQQPFLPQSADGWWVVLALAVVTQCAGQGCIAYALAHLPVHVSTTGLLIQPAVAAAAAWWLFTERLSVWQLMGATVLMLGIYLAQRSNIPGGGSVARHSG
jgi:drug/metabolite transporter (DMT)-like permease